MNPSERPASLPNALDRLIPLPRLVEINSVDLAAPPAAVWARVRHGNLAHSPLVTALFAIRTLRPGEPSLRIDGLISSAEHPGFQLLIDEPPQELAVAAIGKVWEAEIPFVHVETAAEYAAFRQPGYAKVAWAIRLRPYDAGTHLELEVRVDTTDDESWRRFRRYFRLVGIGSRFIRRQLLSELARELGAPPAGDPWREVMAGLGGAAVIMAALLTPFHRRRRNHWGVDVERALRPHSTDALVSAPRWSWTHGVEIGAPAAEVWPWVAQLGADRAGFYSYQWLENIAGCDLRNAEAIHPEWELRVGDRLLLHPELPGLPVVACEPGRWFVAHAAPDRAARAAGQQWVTASWLFEVEPLDETRCRVVSRYRVDCSDDLVARLRFGATLVEPVGFAMDRRMLLGLKRRAEWAATPQPVGVGA